MIDIAEVEKQLNQYTKEIDRRSGELAQYRKNKENYAKEIEQLKADLNTLDKVLVLFNDLGEKQQIELIQKIEGIVSFGLRAVFKEEYNFHIYVSTKHNQTSMDFTVERNGIETEVMSAHGGGLSVVIGFILHVLIIVAMKSQLRQVFVADEALYKLSRDYRDAMGELIQSLAKRLNIQIILVTHQYEYADYADKVLRFGLDKDGHTKITQESKDILYS